MFHSAVLTFNLHRRWCNSSRNLPDGQYENANLRLQFSDWLQLHLMRYCQSPNLYFNLLALNHGSQFFSDWMESVLLDVIIKIKAKKFSFFFQFCEYRNLSRERSYFGRKSYSWDRHRDIVMPWLSQSHFRHRTPFFFFMTIIWNE